MIREIVKPEGNTYVLNLPDDMIGKTIEVVAFEIEQDKPNLLPPLNATQESRLQDIKERYSKLPRISHENYKFDRDEANDYE